MKKEEQNLQYNERMSRIKIEDLKIDKMNLNSKLEEQINSNYRKLNELLEQNDENLAL